LSTLPSEVWRASAYLSFDGVEFADATNGFGGDGCSETLFGSLKVERLHGMEFKDHRDAKDATLEWLLWYNGSRMHSTLHSLSPAQFEQQAINPPLALAA